MVWLANILNVVLLIVLVALFLALVLMPSRMAKSDMRRWLLFRNGGLLSVGLLSSVACLLLTALCLSDIMRLGVTLFYLTGMILQCAIIATIFMGYSYEFILNGIRSIYDRDIRKNNCATMDPWLWTKKKTVLLLSAVLLLLFAVTVFCWLWIWGCSVTQRL